MLEMMIQVTLGLEIEKLPETLNSQHPSYLDRQRLKSSPVVAKNLLNEQILL